MPKFESFDKTVLSFEDDGDGEIVVLLHGFAVDTNVNYVRSGLLDTLLDAGYHVVALDARAHGLSEKPHEPERYADDAMVRDVRALFDEIGVSRCAVVGYSMGATTAVRVAETDERVAALVLLGAGSTMLMRADADGRRPMVEAFSTDDVSSLPERPRAFREMADAIHGDIVALHALLQTPWPEVATDIDQVSAPVLVVAGVDDTHIGSADELATALPQAELVWVPGDHFTANSQRELHDAVVDFLGRTL